MKENAIREMILTMLKVRTGTTHREVFLNISYPASDWVDMREAFETLLKHLNLKIVVEERKLVLKDFVEERQAAIKEADNDPKYPGIV